MGQIWRQSEVTQFFAIFFPYRTISNDVYKARRLKLHISRVMNAHDGGIKSFKLFDALER